MDENLRPLNNLREVMKRYPDLGKRLNTFVAEKNKKLPNWHDCVLLPIAVWKKIAQSYGDETETLSGIAECHRLAAIGTWRYSQGIYRFHDEIYKSLIETEIPDIIPFKLLLRLPEWCIYIETPNTTMHGNILHGVYAFWDHDYVDSSVTLKLVFDRDDFHLAVPIPLLDDNSSIAAALSRLLYKDAPDWARAAFSFVEEIIKPIMSLLLYICSDEPEIDDARMPGSYPDRVYPKKVKGGFKLFVPERARIWDVGKHTGEIIAKAQCSSETKQSSEYKSPAPHLRRAHWHGYRTGKGRKTFEFRWLSPIAVNVRDGVD
jgi:hypothetical protein